MIGARILVVEDDAKIAAILVDYLQQAGFAAELERDGLRAVARVRERAPDCMLLDLNLQGSKASRYANRFVNSRPFRLR